MAVTVFTANSFVVAWIAATRQLLAVPDHAAFNVVLDIEAPSTLRDEDRRALSRVSDFLEHHDTAGISTVANTIFPAGLYARFGPNGVYSHYPDKVFPRIKDHPANRWGTYAYRLVRRIGPDGAKVNPLQRVIEKLKREGNRSGGLKSHFELNLSDAFVDIGIADPTLPGPQYQRGGPCLSHLSFKITAPASVSVVAFYRTHFYVQRALGNLLGLTQLLSFVATEAGLKPGALTCISSYARIDQDGGWTLTSVRDLLSECESILARADSS